MSYISTGSDLSFDHVDALDVTPDELRKLSPDKRVELRLRHYEVVARKREAFWCMVQGFAVLAVLFGLARRP